MSAWWLCLASALPAAAAFDGTRCSPDHPLTVENLEGLDLAFVAFFKSGSSSFRAFFDGHPDITVYHSPHHHEAQRERMEVERNLRVTGGGLLDRPEGSRRVLVAETFARNPEFMSCLLRASPHVKLLVLIREPVSWLQSLYNFLVFWRISGTYDQAYFLPPFFEVLKGQPFGNSRFDLTSAFMSLQIQRTVLPSLPPYWRSVVRRMPLSRTGFNVSSPLLVIDINSLREDRGLEVVATLERFMGLRRPFPPRAVAELRDSQRGHNKAGSWTEGGLTGVKGSPRAARPRYVDLCHPRMADNLTRLADFYAAERLRMQALILSQVGSGIPSKSLEQPGASLCGRRAGR